MGDGLWPMDSRFALLRARSILPAISSFGGSDRSGSSQTNLVVVGGMYVET